MSNHEFDRGIAIIGMTLKATPELVSPAGIEALEFRDEAETVNAPLPELRKMGIEAIVVLPHEGGIQSAGLSDINSCDGDLAGSPLADIVSRLDDAVDLVATGHTHAAYNCSDNTVDSEIYDEDPRRTPRPTGLANHARRLVPVQTTLPPYDPTSPELLAPRVFRLGLDRRGAGGSAFANALSSGSACMRTSAKRAASHPSANQAAGSEATNDW